MARRRTRSDDDDEAGDVRRRAIWKGTISFGLVEIPVALRSAVARDQELSLTLLDKKDFSPLGYERVSKVTGRKVPWEDTVKGYEYEKGEYVVLTEDELKAANVEATQTIDIRDFVEAKDIDIVYWDTPYYLEPLNKKSKSYALLREVLETSGRVAVATVVIRTRQRLAAITVRDDVLVLETLRFAYEVQGTKDIAAPRGSASSLGLTSKEVAMAEQLVESMSAAWKPEAYRDTYREDVRALVRRKVKAGKTKVVEVPDAPRRARSAGDVLDLMPLLERSMKGGSKRDLKAVSAGTRRSSRRLTRRKPA